MQPQLKYSTSAKLHTRTNKQGLRALYVTYTYDKQTTLFPTTHAVNSEWWDNTAKLAIVGTPEAVRINGTIQQMQQDILAVAAKLSKPTHELVKRMYAEQAYQASKQELNKFWDLAVALGENEQIADAEQKLASDKQALKARKKAHAPARVEFGLESPEELATKAAQEQLQNLWKEFAGTGEKIDLRKPDTKHKKRDVGTLTHYKEATYNSMLSMWKIVNEFAEYSGYSLTLANINLSFYQKFGDFILFNRKSKDVNGNWIDGETCYNTSFGSLIKRLKTFLKWVANDKGIAINAQVNSRKFKALEDENEVIILSDYHYQLLADFREAPECNPTWVKHIDITLFQTSVGLRHSDMKRATWRIEGEIVDGVDNRVIKGNTMKNKSKYIIPVYLKPEWTIDILEKYNFDFNEPSEASKKKGAKKSINILLLNNTIRKVLKVIAEKHNTLNQPIRIFKKKWSEEYLIGEYCHWQLHSSHDNRRAFITRMFRLKFNEKTISTMVGARTLGELRKYQQVADEDFFSARK